MRYAQAKRESKDYDETNFWVGVGQMGVYAVSVFFFMGGIVLIISSDIFIKNAKQANRNSFVTFLYMTFRRYMRFAPVTVFIEFYMT